MTETGSGVVYDRRPLDGVEVRVVDGELQLRCPMLLRCYRDGTDPRTPTAGSRPAISERSTTKDSSPSTDARAT